MWCLETIKQVNAKALDLVNQGKSQKDALAECGITIQKTEGEFPEFTPRKHLRTMTVEGTAS